MKFSYSAIEKYKMCPKMYKLHYKDRLREEGIASSLVFGKALDMAFNSLLLRKKDNLTADEQIIADSDPFDVFVKNMQETGIKYFKSDLDEDLLTDHDRQAFKDDIDRLSFISLVNKGKLILEAYQRQVMPRIHKVLSIQSDKELLNTEGDILVSKTDFICEWEKAGNMVLFDNKTASKRYLLNSVKTSYQLSIYSEAEEITQCGYIVCIKKMLKKTRKVCRKCGVVSYRSIKKCSEKACKSDLNEFPEISVDIQILVDNIPQEQKDFVFEDLSRFGTKIKEEKFEPNYENCFQYGRKCAFYNFCHGGGSMVGLKKLEEGER